MESTAVHFLGNVSNITSKTPTKLLWQAGSRKMYPRPVVKGQVQCSEDLLIAEKPIKSLETVLVQKQRDSLGDSIIQSPTSKPWVNPRKTANGDKQLKEAERKLVVTQNPRGNHFIRLSSAMLSETFPSAAVQSGWTKHRTNSAESTKKGSAGHGEDSEKRRRLVAKAIREFRGLSDNADVAALMGRWALHLSKQELLVVMLKQQNWLTAHKLFSWLEKQHDCDEETYIAYVKVLGNFGHWVMMDALLLKLESSEGPPSVTAHLYESVMYGYSRKGMTDKVVDSFYRMVAAGVEPREKSYIIAMAALKKASDLKCYIPQAERILVNMNTQGLKALVPFNCMLEMYLTAGKPRSALQLLAEMAELGVAMDVFTFNASLKAFGMEGNVEAAHDLFHWMAARAEHSPTQHTYTIMLGIYSRARRMEDAMKLLGSMGERGLQPDLTLNNTLLLYMGASLMVKEVRQLYAQLQLHGPAPNLDTYRHVIGAFGRAKRLRDCHGVLDDFEAAGHVAGKALFDSVLRACSHAIRQSDDVDSLLQRLAGMGWCASAADVAVLLSEFRKTYTMPTQVMAALQGVRSGGGVLPEKTYDCLVGYHFYRANMEAMQGVVAEMQRHGFKPQQGTLCMVMDLQGTQGQLAGAEATFRQLAQDEGRDRDAVDLVSYNTLLNAYAVAGLPQKALAVLALLQRHGLAPDTRTWTLLVKAHGSAGQVEGALRVFRDMQAAECAMDEIAYNTVINVCGPALSLEESVGLYRRMVLEGHRPNAVTHNAVLSLLARSDRLSEAHDLFKRLKRSNIADCFAFTSMAAAYGKRGEFELMEEVVEECRQAHGPAMAASVYNAAVDAYGKAGLWEEMEGVVTRMAEHGVHPNTITFNTMVYAYGAAKLLPAMEEVVERQKSWGVARDVWSYNILIGAYGQLEMPLAAVKAFREMQEAGISPDKVTYVNLINAFRKCGDFLEAARWSLWMKQAGFERPAGADSDDPWSFLEGQ